MIATQQSEASHEVRPCVKHYDGRRDVVGLPARGLLAAVWLYQRTLSPVLPVMFGPACGCRFHPTCSHYAAEAVSTHGALAGVWLAARRLLKCLPLHPGGFDPVPPRRGGTGNNVGGDTPPTSETSEPAIRPRCVRVAG